MYLLIYILSEKGATDQTQYYVSDVAMQKTEVIAQIIGRPALCTLLKFSKS
jgi:hypothetical protein